MSKKNTLLKILWRGGVWSYYWTLTVKSRTKYTHWHRLPEFVDAPNAANADIYFNVYPLSDAIGESPSSKIRGKAGQVAAANCLYADFDVGNGKDFASKDAVLQHIEDNNIPKPNALVNSGGGYHCYWLFEEPFIIATEQDYKLFAALEAQWVELVGADTGAKDLARVLRVPGTLNHKYDPPREVVLEYIKTDTLGTFDNYRSLIGALTPEPAHTPPPGGTHNNTALTPNPEKWLTKYVGEASEGNRNATGLLLASQLRDDGLTFDEARQWITSYQTSVTTSDSPYTISEAIASLRSAYSMPIREPARDITKPAYNPMPDVLTPSKQDNTEKDNTSNGNSLTDRSAARRLAMQTTDLQWVKGWKWVGWDGKRWQRDAKDIAIKATATIAEQYRQHAWTYEEDSKERKAFAAFAGRLDNRTGCENLLYFAQGMLTADSQDFDTHHYKLNMANGTLDMINGELQVHQKDDNLTQITTVDYNPDATAPRWEQFLREIMAGDEEMIAFLQQAIGYSLTGTCREQVLFFMHGGGENGKGVFLRAIRDALGEYAKEAAPNLLTAGDRHPTEVANLLGARFVTTSETNAGERLAEGLVKRLTGEDQLSARFMGGDFFNFDATFKLWLNANHKPQIRGTDEGIWRRIKLIPFEVSFAGEKKDTGLSDALAGELPGILNWTIQGCQSYLKNGLQYPEKIVKATSDYRAESDQLGNFFEERCIITPVGDPLLAGKIKSAELFGVWTQWCEGRNEKQGTLTTFGKRMMERGFEKKRQKDGVYYLGVELCDENTAPSEVYQNDKNVIKF